ncbi:16S rRNA (guanine(527)-N(7))-methyltransferase RsmG [Permianibacter sp. IMCC34836]|uniref:16S rRNA (guanine(527)-N(7))-methyltransferase RsmG n=1 Tax=Permianibacter fluminis TaxID=2738515 RepID=UPI001554F782|nr:16S rRNA (guanine(527)-N(7))-methyltransferase RsmG [Permianibacter fluminis]NQD36040.1 16S rRNA (guanine(527)-N(7))-methyltransferase RsmG [Permianibacter fluminis]
MTVDQKLHQALSLWSLPSTAAAPLQHLLNELLKWNSAFNLTAIRDPDEALTLHILDSLTLLPYVTGPRLLDVGTGPGFPALPLAILRPDVQITALDSNGKKIRFIRQMAHELKLDNIEPVQARVEQHQGQYQQITSRAFAELKLFLDLTGHLLAPGGEWLAMKSQSAAAEIAQLPAGLQAEVLPLQVPGLQAERCLVRVRR